MPALGVKWTMAITSDESTVIEAYDDDMRPEAVRKLPIDRRGGSTGGPAVVQP